MPWPSGPAGASPITTSCSTPRPGGPLATSRPTASPPCAVPRPQRLRAGPRAAAPDRSWQRRPARSSIRTCAASWPLPASWSGCVAPATVLEERAAGADHRPWLDGESIVARDDGDGAGSSSTRTWQRSRSTRPITPLRTCRRDRAGGAARAFPGTRHSGTPPRHRNGAPPEGGWVSSVLGRRDRVSDAGAAGSTSGRSRLAAPVDALTYGRDPCQALAAPRRMEPAARGRWRGP